jgi:hypothetical protein
MNKLTTYKRNLFSNNENEVLDTLYLLRDNGYPELIPDLFRVYTNNLSIKVKDEIMFLLNNVKNKEAVPYFIQGLEENMNNPFRHKFIESCWQNGLDFSLYISFFIKIVANEPFENAFEAFTVIENNCKLAIEEMIVDMKRIIDSIIKENSQNNKALMIELQKLFD